MILRSPQGSRCLRCKGGSLCVDPCVGIHGLHWWLAPRSCKLEIGCFHHKLHRTLTKLTTRPCKELGNRTHHIPSVPCNHLPLGIPCLRTVPFDRRCTFWSWNLHHKSGHLDWQSGRCTHCNSSSGQCKELGSGVELEGKDGWWDHHNHLKEDLPCILYHHAVPVRSPSRSDAGGECGLRCRGSPLHNRPIQSTHKLQEPGKALVLDHKA